MYALLKNMWRQLAHIRLFCVSSLIPGTSSDRNPTRPPSTQTLKLHPRIYTPENLHQTWRRTNMYKLPIFGGSTLIFGAFFGFWRLTGHVGKALLSPSYEVEEVTWNNFIFPMDLEPQNAKFRWKNSDFFVSVFFGMRKRGPVNFGAEIAVCEFGCWMMTVTCSYLFCKITWKPTSY